MRKGKEGSRGRTVAPTITDVGLLITSRVLSKAFASEPKGTNGPGVSATF
jgi:hypothetical protein